MEQDPPQMPEVSEPAASPPLTAPGATPYRLRRVDTAGNDALTHLGRLGADTFGYTAALTVEPRLAQLLRLRVAQINHCAYCLELHHAAARAAGIADPVIDTLSAWWETDFHDPATRAALAYTEALTLLADPQVSRSFEERHRDLAAHFDESAILEIVGVVVNMNVWTRLKLAEGAAPGFIE
jgi:AhpD family alkylhydroperoxidase